MSRCSPSRPAVGMPVNAQRVRGMQPGDFARVLQLNHAAVHFLSPLDDARLAALHGMAACRRVGVDGAGQVRAFLLALREGAAYDSPNYRWFVQRHPQFLYVDRIVVADTHQGRGLGRMLYGELLAFARASGVATVTCEIDTDPPNPRSLRFHAAIGFRTVGTQCVGASRKRVALQALDMSPPAG